MTALRSAAWAAIWWGTVTAPVLDVEGLTIRYGSLTAVSDASFRAEAGKVTAVLGPNGAGKSSAIEACTGLRRPASGTINLLGSTPTDPAVRARIGVMLQEGGLYPTARPLEWLRYLTRLYPKSVDPAELLRRLGIDPGSRTATRRLSGGQARAVKLAAALVHQPEVLFLDEPTAGLDPDARHRLLDIVRELRLQGRSIILSTHLLADVEALADHVIVLADGRVHADGTIDELTQVDSALRFAGPAGLDLAGLIAVLPPGHLVRETSPGNYLVDGPVRPDVVSTVAAWCAEHDALAAGLRPGRRSIEDIVRSASGPNPSHRGIPDPGATGQVDH